MLVNDVEDVREQYSRGQRSAMVNYRLGKPVPYIDYREE